MSVFVHTHLINIPQFAIGGSQDVILYNFNNPGDVNPQVAARKNKLFIFQAELMSRSAEQADTNYTLDVLYAAFRVPNDGSAVAQVGGPAPLIQQDALGTTINTQFILGPPSFGVTLSNANGALEIAVVGKVTLTIGDSFDSGAS